ncbi:MAG: cell envelope integrity protein CreD [Alphaproteobacteria bacterium]|nr:MAG: cell envelope integrity protein CreD [Alphaproteobacteria bacterium]
MSDMETAVGGGPRFSLGGPGVKAALVGLLLLVLLIPLSMINGLIGERSNRAIEVMQSVGRTWGYEQTVAGPLLVLPYDHVISRTTSGEERLERRQLVLLPAFLKADGKVDVEPRQIGLYETKVYTAHMTLEARFDVPELFDGVDPGRLHWDEAVMSLALSDLQGLQGDLELVAAGQSLRIAPGVGFEGARYGVHAPLAGKVKPGEGISLGASFSLRGSSMLSIWPSGEKSEISLTSAWPSPGFGGRFSPISHTITDAGFDAKWQTLRLAQGIGPVLAGDKSLPYDQAVSVRFVDPVNRYSMVERSAKYGALFVLLTFSVLYLFEVMSKSRVHPVQYMLTGLALCLFFMGLLALAEHMPFAAAYALASVLVIGLVTAYARSVTRSARWTGSILATQVVLFGFLYSVLKMEDMALLSGTVLLFAGLAAAMYLTRRVDWYRIGAPS